MKRARLIGKIHLKGYSLLLVQIIHDNRPDLEIYFDLFDLAENYGIENGLEYKEIVNRKRTTVMYGEKSLPASQYTVLMEKTRFIDQN